MRHSPFEDMFDVFNRVFGVFDSEFRDMEKRFGVRNALPSVSVPSVKTYSYYEDIRSYDDGNKVETYKNGKLHGPVKYHDGNTPDEYWIEGKVTTKEEWGKHLEKLEDERIHEVVVDGVPHRLSGKQVKELKTKINEVLKIEKKS